VPGILALLPTTEPERIVSLSAARDKAFTLAQETIRQEITLSTGIFALTLTFLKDFTSGNASKTLVEIAWGGYLASTLCGVFALMCLAGQLENATDESPATINGPVTRTFAILQALLFIAALGVTLAFGVGYAKV
jgi:hypothetical protein